MRVDTSSESGTPDLLEAFGADLDGDGDQDVIERLTLNGPIAANGPRIEHMVVRIWERDGDELRKRLDIAPSEDSSRAVLAVVDADGDGFSDIVSMVQRAPVVYRGDGAFHFKLTKAEPAIDDALGVEARWL